MKYPLSFKKKINCIRKVFIIQVGTWNENSGLIIERGSEVKSITPVDDVNRTRIVTSILVSEKIIIVLSC